MTDEAARLDVWLALLTLELSYGDDKSLEGMFDRAVRQNDAETMYVKMAQLYNNAERPDDARRLLLKASKKFSYSLGVWEALGRHELGQANVDGFQHALKRAMSALPKRDELLVVSKYAQLEFELGSAERARTLFEGIVANHPKRIDQWNIYADMEIKHGDASAARRVFERMSSLRLSSKKMRAALKRWLGFETQHGTDDDAERVRQKARDYVASVAAKSSD